MRQTFKPLLCLWCLLAGVLSFAQHGDPFEPVDTDSLRLVLKQGLPGSQTIRILETLILQAKPETDSDTLWQYYQRLIELNTQEQTIDPAPVKLFLLALEHTQREHYDSAIYFTDKLVSWYDLKKIPLGLSSPLATIRELFNLKGDANGRLKYYSRKLDYYLLNGPEMNTATCYHGLAGYYVLTGNLNEAISNYLKAAEVFKNYAAEDYTNELYCVAAYYYYWGNLARAEYYYKLVLRYRDSGFYSTPLAYLDLAYIRKEQKSYQPALRFIDSAEHYAKALEFTEELPYIMLERAVIYIKTGRLAEALSLLEELRKLEEEHEILLYSSGGEFELDYGWHEYYNAIGDNAAAVRALQQGLKKAYKLNHSAFVLKYLKELANATQRTAPNRSRDYMVKYLRLKDSLDKETALTNIAYYETVLQEKQQLQKIDSLKLERDAQSYKLSEQQKFLSLSVLAISLLMVLAFTLFVGFRNKAKANKIISQEKQKSEDLLLNILPQEVAEELKENGNAKAKHFDMVTVLFTDFVNFTKAGERMGAQELVDELHACFKGFDQIIAEYGIEKIKTIGDAYMAVCGLPAPDEDHAIKIAMAAIEIRQFVATRRQQFPNKAFDIRIGIHSGPVVAGIVGVKKFAYDIWGDTVNTAARMEQTSEPGKINISEATYKLIRNRVSCTYRGAVKAKSKGAMKMYFIDEASITRSHGSL